MEKTRVSILYFFCICLAVLFFFGISDKAYAEGDSPTLQQINERGTLNWGSDVEGGAPYEFYQSDNTELLVGFEVDIIKEIASRLNVGEKMVQNEWDALIQGLIRKNYDIAIAGIELTESRKQKVNFTRPYYIYSQQIVVRKDQKSPISTLDDLVGKEVGTLNGSAALRILENKGNIEIKRYPSVVGAYQDLETGRTDAVLLDVPIATYYAKPNPALKLVGEPFGEGYYAIAVRKEDTQLLNSLNKAITEMIESGKLEEILKNWDIWTKEQVKLASFDPDSTENIPQNAKKNSDLNGKKLINLQNVNSENLAFLMKGAWMTIKITIISMFFAVILGLTLAVVRMYAPKPFSFLSAAYVEIFRGTPLLVQLYIIYYGLPNLGINIDAFPAAVLGLALNYAAYEAENYRAGIRSIPKGQMEAALALGMTKAMALKKIIVPQAVKVVIPPVTNDFIAMFKDSSIVSVITMVELTKSYSILASANYSYIDLGLMTAAFYFLMSYPASIFARNIERRLANEAH